MARIALTEQQKEVVSNRGGNLLVSAAAGAGKTEVLAERIMSRVIGEKEDITKFLIITFTRDAAAQLRAKIINKLSEALAQDPHNEHLQKQVHLVYAAQISTVHAFCGNILRANASAIGLTPDFRLMDDAECRTMRAEVMNDVMEQVYVNVASSPDIAAFLDLTVGRDDLAVQAIIHRVYDTIQSHPWPHKWMETCISNMQVEGTADAAETPWGQYIVDDIKRYASRQITAVQSAIELCDTDTALSAAYRDALVNDLARIKGLSQATQWNQVYEFKGEKWARLKSPKKGADYDVSIQAAVKALRDRYKAGINGKLTAINGDSSEVIEDLKKTSPSIAGLFALVELFDKEYQARKMSHGLMDYNDLEHYTIRLLLDEGTGARTEVGNTIVAQYREVVVDEYQDTNAVQETIFEALSNGCNRFMVGDVKQSIYAFRQADPTIFLQHYEEYLPYDDAAAGQPRKVSLTKNFRSRPEILEATNSVMHTCMSREVGGIEYNLSESLVAGRTDSPPLAEPVVELVTIDMDCPGDDAGADDDGTALAKVDVEARYVASRIRKMLDEERIMDDKSGGMRPIRPSDIAVLLRAAKNTARHYVKALSELGIASKSTKNGSLLDSEEIATLYCFLQIVDNPYQDVPLVGVLASPLFGFTAEELGQAKISNKKAVSFFESVQTYAQSSEKARRFLSMLNELRDMVPYTRLVALYNRIVDSCDACAVYGAMRDGKQREANIFAFGELISDYERKSARGLFQFLCYIESMREQGVDFSQPSIGAENDAVTVVSTHTSKGLEYPVVFLSDLSRQFNKSDTKNSVLMDKDLGIGVQVYDIDLDYRYPTIARNSIASKGLADAKSEELRILYVGMTRAKQRLIMTYCSSISKALAKMAESIDSPLPPAVSQGVNCPGDWVMLTALSRNEGEVLYHFIGAEPPFKLHGGESPWAITCVKSDDIGGTKRTLEELEVAEEEAIPDRVPETSCAGPDPDAIKRDLDFMYSHYEATKTQSTAAPTSLNRTSPQIKVQFHEYGVEKTVTAAQRGTSIHKFMQYANYRICATGASQVKAELDRMRMDGFLSEEESRAVNLPMLQHFFASDVGKKLALLPDKNLHREFRFSLLVPAKDALPNSTTDEPVLLSGIIDLFVEGNDQIGLFDFKSDYIADNTAIAEKTALYTPQLNVYARALEQICHKPVTEKTLIFLHPAVAQKIT